VSTIYAKLNNLSRLIGLFFINSYHCIPKLSEWVSVFSVDWETPTVSIVSLDVPKSKLTNP